MQENYELILKTSTILLAEDEEVVRKSFEKVLNLYAKRVFTASDGEEALDIYEKEHPDIIITDIKMPKLNGIELIKLIRKNNHDIPIVVTSAYADQEFLLESIKLLLVEYVIKPIKESDLNRVLSECAKVLLEKSKTIISFDEESYYDFTNKVFINKGKNISLTNKEVEFFEILLAHRGDLVTKQAIEDKLYVYDEAPPSALKNLVFKLRKKIPPHIIETHGKLGYLIKLTKN